ncbi:MAG: Coenzyme F420 hydrogenase/dehydrogenase, beta subunit C-terminal domain [Bacteroidales bacterium]|nr:Coenzyme F420 hydrogenase/dehydrogenase, beta subunit C-terminal domain [Bacteroidales bacterium]
MINIKNKQDCCGCSACVQCCPKQCIKLYEDEEGFLYPKVDNSICIDCGLCERVCPVLNQAEERKPIEVFAAKNPNEEIRKESSSGGIFTLLAEQTIDAGGVVFGVKWNEHFEAVHAYTETKDGLADFRGSKYVQSQVGDTFKLTEQFLRQGRQVLYSGTPCQIAALKLYLRKDYENLLAIDIICHGAPSPGVFRWYLAEELQKAVAKQNGDKIQFRSLLPISSIAKADVLAREQGFEIKDIRFRDKRFGWKKFSFVLSLRLLSESLDDGEKNLVSLSYTLHENAFMKGFLSNIYLRPSCYACPAKAGKSGSDITLADYWGISSLMPELDDDRGISAIIVNTEKGRKKMQATTAELYPAPYEDICKKNPSLLNSCEIPECRKTFFSSKQKKGFHDRIIQVFYVPIHQRIKWKVYACLGKLKILFCK